MRVKMVNKYVKSLCKPSGIVSHRHIYSLLILLFFLVGCTNVGANAGQKEASFGSGGRQLPPAWTPTPISIPGTGADEGTWQPCDDAPPSRLEVGNLAVVEGTSFNLRLRGEPGLGGTLAGEIAPADVVEIINGPACADGLVWWEVQSLSMGHIGWTAEGNAYGNWLGKVE
jgi:hypothetical protein